jgi:hypothetical protein
VLVLADGAFDANTVLAEIADADGGRVAVGYRLFTTLTGHELAMQRDGHVG